MTEQLKRTEKIKRTINLFVRDKVRTIKRKKEKKEKS